MANPLSARSEDRQSAPQRAAAQALRLEPFAASLFNLLRERTSKGQGIFRDAYGEGENTAHRLIEDAARERSLVIEHDAAANTYMTLRGQQRGSRLIVGSHLDSVADGGNFDGAAGVIAGLVSVAALQATGITPVRDITVMAIRAEESVWFSTSYFGSNAALGTVPDGALDSKKRSDTGKSLREHVALCGGHPDRLMAGERFLQPADIAAYMEVHIEQGPLLAAENLPVGIVTGIRGNYRLPSITIRGEYSHCGGVPRNHRADSVVAGADFVHALDRLWADWDASGKDMAFTVGKFFTDPTQHALTKIPGEVTLSLDVRSVDAKLLSELVARVRTIAHEIGAQRSVTFDLGSSTQAEIGRIDQAIVADLESGARDLDISCRKMASGASHDAAAFAAHGVPTGMIFVRNENGSHNPLEKMELPDFMQAVRLLTWWLARNCMNDSV